MFSFFARQNVNEWIWAEQQKRNEQSERMDLKEIDDDKKHDFKQKKM